MILVVCINNGEYEKQQSVNLMYISMERMCIHVFDVFNIQSYSQTTKSVSLNWQHAAIVEYAMLKLVSNVPPSEIRAGIWMYLSKQCTVLHTFPAHCISIYTQLLLQQYFSCTIKI